MFILLDFNIPRGDPTVFDLFNRREGLLERPSMLALLSLVSSCSLLLKLM